MLRKNKRNLNCAITSNVDNLKSPPTRGGDSSKHKAQNGYSLTERRSGLNLRSNAPKSNILHALIFERIQRQVSTKEKGVKKMRLNFIQKRKIVITAFVLLICTGYAALFSLYLKEKQEEQLLIQQNCSSCSP